MRWWFKIITARRNRTQYRIPSHHRSIRLFVIHIQILLEGDTTYTEWKGEREWMGRKMLSCVKPVNPSGLTFLYNFFFHLHFYPYTVHLLLALLVTAPGACQWGSLSARRYRVDLYLFGRKKGLRRIEVPLGYDWNWFMAEGVRERGKTNPFGNLLTTLELRGRSVRKRNSLPLFHFDS